MKKKLLFWTALIAWVSWLLFKIKKSWTTLKEEIEPVESKLTSLFKKICQKTKK